MGEFECFFSFIRTHFCASDSFKHYKQFTTEEKKHIPSNSQFKRSQITLHFELSEVLNTKKCAATWFDIYYYILCNKYV